MSFFALYLMSLNVQRPNEQTGVGRNKPKRANGLWMKEEINSESGQGTVRLKTSKHKQTPANHNSPEAKLNGKQIDAVSKAWAATKWDWIRLTVIYMISIRHQHKTLNSHSNRQLFSHFLLHPLPRNRFIYLHQPLFITLEPCRSKLWRNTASKQAEKKRARYWCDCGISGWGWRGSWSKAEEPRAPRYTFNVRLLVCLTFGVCASVERKIYEIFMLLVCFFLVWVVFLFAELLSFNCVSRCLTRMWQVLLLRFQ